MDLDELHLCMISHAFVRFLLTSPVSEILATNKAKVKLSLIWVGSDDFILYNFHPAKQR